MQSLPNDHLCWLRLHVTQADQNSAEQIRNTQELSCGLSSRFALPLYVNDRCFVTQLESASWERKCNVRLERSLNQQLWLHSRYTTGRIIHYRTITTVPRCVSHWQAEWLNTHLLQGQTTLPTSKVSLFLRTIWFLRVLYQEDITSVRMCFWPGISYWTAGPIFMRLCVRYN
jgi:hypothetical protein